MMKIEEIIDMLPTVTDLRINTKSRRMYTRRSAQNIAALIGDGRKFDTFCLYQVPSSFNLESFKTFLREHMQLLGFFHLEFRDTVNEQFRLDYKQLHIEVKYRWLPAYQGPQF